MQVCRRIPNPSLDGVVVRVSSNVWNAKRQFLERGFDHLPKKEAESRTDTVELKFHKLRYR